MAKSKTADNEDLIQHVIFYLLPIQLQPNIQHCFYQQKYEYPDLKTSEHLKQFE